MKKFFKRFICEEDGAELVEWAIVIAIAAVIAVPVMALVMNAKNKVEDANQLLGEINPGDYISGGGSQGGGTQGGTQGGTGIGDIH